MRKSNQQLAVLLLFSLAHHVSFVVPCLSAEPQTPGELEAKASRIETMAKAGRPWKPGADGGYYFAAAQLAKQIKESPPDRSRTKLAAHVLEGLLSKVFQIDEITSDDLEKDDKGNIGAADLWAAEDLANYLINNDAASDQDRQTNARLLARYLGRVRRERVPGYKPKDVGLNVAPPVAAPGEMLIAGMDPDDINDPKARAAYKAAIRKREENNIWNRRQSELLGMDQPPTSEAIKRYIADTFHGRPNSDAALAECISAAMFTEKEKKEIERDLGSGSAKAEK